jgi:hypothetical protein
MDGRGYGVSDALDAPEDNPDGIHPSLDERCIHDLVVGQCAHCRPRPIPDPFEEPASRRYGPWFAAAYGGTCAECGDRFDAGEAIRAIGDGEYIGECCGEPGP